MKIPMKSIILKLQFSILFLLIQGHVYGQNKLDKTIDNSFKNILLEHKAFVSIPNLPEGETLMLENINWVAGKYKNLGFETSLLKSETLPLLLAEKIYDAQKPTVLFYFHIDGQPVNPDAWNQDDPFTPVLKQKSAQGNWEDISWDKIDGEIDDDWRIFARAAADDKAPILMLISALEILTAQNIEPEFNIKVIFDPEEEYGSKALLSTLEIYKERYASDYFIVMDGPAHDSNKPTLTFGCRGIALCTITTYGAILPQHSGHFGNYSPNPVFGLSRLLASMKDENGRVLIEDYYIDVNIDIEASKILDDVPFNAEDFNHKLGIHKAETVGKHYQEALQYPSLNVRQIGTSWTGEKMKTVIPEYAVANIDVRLVPETEKEVQLSRIKSHIETQGYYVIDREPTMEERLEYSKIAKFESLYGVNAFRTSTNSILGMSLREQIEKDFGESPVTLRMMGGTVPIIPLINALDVPTVIVPMVNMDNNQHSPNENIRLGNMKQGIKMCLSILQVEF